MTAVPYRAAQFVSLQAGQESDKRAHFLVALAKKSYVALKLLADGRVKPGVPPTRKLKIECHT